MPCRFWKSEEPIERLHGSQSVGVMLILDRASHSLNDEDCKEVALTWATTPTRQVYLHANSLRCTGAEYIAAGLVLLSQRGGAHVLTRLCLHENAIGDCGILVLAEAMRSADLVSLVRLDLSSNAIGNAGAAALVTALLLATQPRPRLEELSLAANRIDKTGFAALLTAVTASEKTCPSLEVVDLRANMISVDAKLAEALAASPRALRMLMQSLREQNHGAVGDHEAYDEQQQQQRQHQAAARLAACVAELQPLVEEREAAHVAQRATEESRRRELEEAARRAAIESEESEIRWMAATVMAAAVETAVAAAADAERCAAVDRRQKIQAESRRVAAELTLRMVEEANREAALRSAELEAQAMQRAAESQRKVEAEEVTRQQAHAARQLVEARAKREVEERARRTETERQKRHEREAKSRCVREVAAARAVARDFESQARVAWVLARKLQGLRERSGLVGAAVATKQRLVRERLIQRIGHEEGQSMLLMTSYMGAIMRRATGPQVTPHATVDKALKLAESVAVAHAAAAAATTAAEVAEAAAAAKVAAIEAVPTKALEAPRAAPRGLPVSSRSSSPSALHPSSLRATNWLSDAQLQRAIADAARQGQSAVLGGPLERAQSAVLSGRPSTSPSSLASSLASSRSTRRYPSVPSLGVSTAVAAATEVTTDKILRSSGRPKGSGMISDSGARSARELRRPTHCSSALDRLSRPTRPASAKSPPRTAAAAANSSAAAHAAAHAAHTLTKYRYAGALEAQHGALEAVRNANAQLRASLPTALPTSAREAASEAMVATDSLAVPAVFARCFMMQSGNGHGQDRLRAALNRRGWNELPGCADLRNLRDCLSNGLGFVWLRGDHNCKVLCDLPAGTSAVINRWPSKPSGSGADLRVLWHKAELVSTLVQYYEAQGLDPWRHHPLTLVLPQGAGAGSAAWGAFRTLFQAMADGTDARVPPVQRTRNIWLLKPTGGCSGRGIGLGDSLEELQSHYDSCRAMEGLQAPSASQAWIAQKYLEAPLLFQGRKFDVRIFALLESASQTELGFALYAYREGYGRTSSEVFTLDELHPTMHLTNFAVQKSAEDTFGLHEAGNSISFPDIERALGSSVGFLARIVPAMHGLMADAVLAARAQLMNTLAAAGAPKATFRTLLAFDLIVEADGTPLLMEINPFPGQTPQNDWHGHYLRRLLDDYVNRCVGTPLTSSAARTKDSTRPLFDGHHVPNSEDDGWVLLLGRENETSSADVTAAFDVIPCGSRHVRVRPTEEREDYL